MDDVVRILRVDVKDVDARDILVDYYPDSDLIVMLDHECNAVEFARDTAIEAARAILKYFNEEL